MNMNLSNDYFTYEKYYRDFKRIPVQDAVCSTNLYHFYVFYFLNFINKDFVAPSEVSEISFILRDLACFCPLTLRERAKRIFIKKNRQRGGLWKDAGLIGSLIEIHAKLSRLRECGIDEDSMVDLFNYCLISLMCIEKGYIKVGPRTSRPLALVTGGEKGLGETIIRTMELNGIEAWNLPREFLSSPEEAKTYFSQWGEDTRPYFDFVVNNYGENYLNWLGELEERNYALLQTNLAVPIAIVDELVKLGNVCKILNIASQTYRVPQRCTSVYCASKAGLTHFTKVAARELAPKGFVVNALAPGKIEGTRMSELTDKQVLELRGWAKEKAERYAKENIPAGRNTTKEEVALAVLKTLYLPDYVNGSVIDMTGGQ